MLFRGVTKNTFNELCSFRKSKQNICSAHFFRRAANETRTRDPDLGKVVLYQLSYCRIAFGKSCFQMSLARHKAHDCFRFPHHNLAVMSGTPFLEFFQRAQFLSEKRMQKYNKFLNFANFRPSNSEKHPQIRILCYLRFAISPLNGWHQSLQASLPPARVSPRSCRWGYRTSCPS